MWKLLYTHYLPLTTIQIGIQYVFIIKTNSCSILTMVKAEVSERLGSYDNNISLQLTTKDDS